MLLSGHLLIIFTHTMILNDLIKHNVVNIEIFFLLECTFFKEFCFKTLHLLEWFRYYGYQFMLLWKTCIQFGHNLYTMYFKLVKNAEMSLLQKEENM